MSKNVSSISKITLGIALIALGMLLFLKKPGEVVQNDSFENEPVKVELLPNENLDEKEIPKRIIIPELGIDLEVAKANVINGYWEVYKDKAGWGVGSGLPGQSANQVIFAHAREGLFKPLRSIKVEDKIYVLNDQNWYDYKVSDIVEVDPSQTEVIGPAGEEILTLYTCSGFSDEKRLIVKAKPAN